MDASTIDEPLPLTELAYRQLRRAIVRCEYAPGDRLRVEELGRRFEISNIRTFYPTYCLNHEHRYHGNECIDCKAISLNKSISFQLATGV